VPYECCPGVGSSGHTRAARALLRAGLCRSVELFAQSKYAARRVTVQTQTGIELRLTQPPRGGVDTLEKATLPFVIPSEAEGPAVSPPNTNTLVSQYNAAYLIRLSLIYRQPVIRGFRPRLANETNLRKSPSSVAPLASRTCVK
jgi:hypothetical protein